MYAATRDITPLWYHARKGTCISCLSFKDAFTFYILHLHLHLHTHTHTHHSCGHPRLPGVGPSGPARGGGAAASAAAPRGGTAHCGTPYPLPYPPAWLALRFLGPSTPVFPAILTLSCASAVSRSRGGFGGSAALRRSRGCWRPTRRPGVWLGSR